MEFNRILAATDGSDHAHRALVIAAGLCRRIGAQLTVATVVYVPRLYRTDLGTELVASFRDDAEKVLAAARRELAATGVNAAFETLEGDPAVEIARLAATGDSDLVVLGRRGLSRHEGKPLGSVSEGVLKRADCSVLLVR
jgi:nucleotide-binding universal stress UspA family protein